MSRWKLPLILMLVAATVVASGCASAQVAPANPAAPLLPTSAQAGGSTIVAIAPPAQQCCPRQTLPQFLGLTGLGKGIAGIIDRIRNRLGARYPGLEAKPAILALTDPANMQSDNPAIKSAAEVKAEEDQAAQKAKAIRYLGTVGCGDCYPDVADALLAALDDCTEVVRYEAVVAIRKTAGCPCEHCKNPRACCSPKMRAKLTKIAYDMTDEGCFKEHSDRVRRVARLALCQCGGPAAPEEPQQLLPKEGPPGAEEPSLTVKRSPPPNAQTIQQATAIAATPSPQPAAGEKAEPLFAQLLGQEEPPAQEVRWEHISLRMDQFTSRMDASAVMTMIRARALGGNGAIPRDLPPTAVRTQRHEWTACDAIASPLLGQVLVQTAVGGVSNVWEDGGMLHMVRVLERRTAPQHAVQPAAFQQPATAPPKQTQVLLQPPAAKPCNCNH